MSGFGVSVSRIVTRAITLLALLTPAFGAHAAYMLTLNGSIGGTPTQYSGTFDVQNCAGSICTPYNLSITVVGVAFGTFSAASRFDTSTNRFTDTSDISTSSAVASALAGPGLLNFYKTTDPFGHNWQWLAQAGVTGDAGGASYTATLRSVPEPASYALLGLVGLSLLVATRRRDAR